MEAGCREPRGPDQKVRERPLDGRWRHPVVHVSWNEARAYAHWVGKHLHTEAEWEKAPRGGASTEHHPWGDELTPDGRHLVNIWQGRLLVEDLGLDGYLSTAPVDAYRPNGYGLYCVLGNVWERCWDL